MNNLLSKSDYIKALEKAEQSGRDKIGVAGEMGIQSLAGIGSGAAASVLLTSVVTTTSTVTAPVLGSTFLGGLVGAEAVVTSTAILAAPVTAVIAAGVGGLVVSYFLIKMVKSGLTHDKNRIDYLNALREKITNYDKVASNSNDNNSKIAKLAGIYALLLKLDAITMDKVQAMFKGITAGVINADFAIKNAKDMISNASK